MVSLKKKFPFEADQYQLIDFGENEKLESFAGTLVRRETPSATGMKSRDPGWELAELAYQQTGADKGWSGNPVEEDWQVRFDQANFEIRLTPTGQVGIFPEQAANWDWILENDFSGMKALNLFGYTGGASLALARAGANVVHCDSAKSVVNWARSNAKSSGLEEAPIRWIVEDAMKFVEREIKRNNQYEIVVADPPSFGRGPKGESWKIQRNLQSLIQGLSELTRGRCEMILLSCHTPEFNHVSLSELVSREFTLDGKEEAYQLSIPSSTGKQLKSGSCFRWKRAG